MAYRKVVDPNTGLELDVVQRIADGAFVPSDPNNADRREYDRWLALGNEPADAIQ